MGVHLMNGLSETGSFSGFYHCADSAAVQAINQKGFLSKFRVSNTGINILDAVLNHKRNRMDIFSVASVDAYKSLSDREIESFENVLNNYLSHFLNKQNNAGIKGENDFFVNFSQYQLILKLEKMA